jgi:hypothetical protein
MVGHAPTGNQTGRKDAQSSMWSAAQAAATPTAQPSSRDNRPPPRMSRTSVPSTSIALNGGVVPTVQRSDSR